jgi:hypothetical protein
MKLTTIQKRLPSFAPEALAGLAKMVFPLLIGVGVLFILDRVQHDTVITLAQTRPIITILTLMLVGVSVWGIARVIPLTAVNRERFAWKMSFRTVGWIGLVGSGVGLVIMMLAKDTDPKSFPLAGVERLVEAVVPLAVGMQAAFLFAPDDEPSMEVLLACPRPIAWLLLERLLVLAVLQSLAALVGVGLSIALSGSQDVPLLFIRWISPALFLGGIGVYTTWRSRQPAFGVAVVGLVWFLFGFMGAVFKPGMPTFWPLSLIQPFLWSVHVYLQPDYLTSGDYVLNRLLLAGIGIALVMLTARQLRDEERILTGGKLGKSSKGE